MKAGGPWATNPANYWNPKNEVLSRDELTALHPARDAAQRRAVVLGGIAVDHTVDADEAHRSSLHTTTTASATTASHRPARSTGGSATSTR